MTRQQNARVAGFMFLFYIAIGVAQAIIGGGASAGNDAATKLASMANHAAQVRTNALLGLLMAFTAMVLAAALYGLTRDQDQDLAVLALSFRIGEGVLGAIPTLVSLTLLSLAAIPSDSGGASSLFRLRSLAPLVSAIFFAAGSTIFAYLLLKGRVIPVALAWLGVAASALLVVVLPLQLVGVMTRPATQAIWIPMAAFEIPLGFWLLIRGVDDRGAHAR
jgi:uncharacterized MAPEG superfamily protein